LFCSFFGSNSKKKSWIFLQNWAKLNFEAKLLKFEQEKVNFTDRICKIDWVCFFWANPLGGFTISWIIASCAP
jgi:hypothetical protein